MEALVLRNKKAYFRTFDSRCDGKKSYKEIWEKMEKELIDTFGIGVYDDYDTFIKAKNRHKNTIVRS